MAVELARAAHGTVILYTGGGYPVGCVLAGAGDLMATPGILLHAGSTAPRRACPVGPPIRKSWQKLRNF